MNIEENLICNVQKYECLYNMKSKYYSDQHVVNNAWTKVSADLNMSVAECKKLWKKLRDSYRKSLRLRESKSGSARTYDRAIKYEKELQFIKPFIQNKKQTTNLDSSPEVTDIESQSVPSPRHSISRPLSQSSWTPTPQNEQPKLSTMLYKQYMESKLKEDDPTISFFLTMGRTVKRMPAKVQAELKKEIFRLVNNEEIKQASFESNEAHNSSTDLDTDATGIYTTDSPPSPYIPQPISRTPQTPSTYTPYPIPRTPQHTPSTYTPYTISKTPQQPSSTYTPQQISNFSLIDNRTETNYSNLLNDMGNEM